MNGLKIDGQTNYGTVYLDSTGTVQTVSPGSSGQVLTSNGSSAAPTFQAAGGGGSSWSIASVTGSDFTSSGNANITGLSFTAAANTNYEVDIWLDVTNSNGGGTKVALSQSVSGATWFLVGPASGVSGGSSALLLFMVGAGTATFDASSSVEVFANFRGIVKNGSNSNTISVQIQPVGSSTVTVKIGSKLNYRPQ